MASRTRLFSSLLLALMVAGASPAWAGKAEPEPPGGTSADEERPTRATRTVQETPPPGTEVTTAPTSGRNFEPLDWKNAIGVYVRYLFVTNLMLRPYLAASTQMNSYAVGLQYLRRYHSFDVVTSLDFSAYRIDDGNWLGKGNDPTQDTKYVQFQGLSFLSADVAIVGHHAFNDWLELRGGAGLGLGIVFGNVLTTSDSQQVCTKQNAGNTSQCFPISPSVGPIMLNQPDTNAKLKQTENSAILDTSGDPHRKNSFKPPVLPVLDIFMALNFRVHRNVSLQVEVGFRNAMFTGANFQYHF